jgi:hypothetical protein
MASRRHAVMRESIFMTEPGPEVDKRSDIGKRFCGGNFTHTGREHHGSANGEFVAYRHRCRAE